MGRWDNNSNNNNKDSGLVDIGTAGQQSMEEKKMKIFKLTVCLDMRTLCQAQTP